MNAHQEYRFARLGSISALRKIQSSFGTFPGRSAAAAVLAMALLAVIFFIAQRQFMQGIVITGVEK